MAETGHQAAETRTSPVAGQPAEAQTTHRPMISVELVIQQFAAAQPAPAQGEVPPVPPGAQASQAGHGVQAARPRAPRYELFRSVHRVPAGTTIRQLLRLACPAPGVEAQPHGHGQPTGADQLIADIENRTRGLSRHGRRAWLDDVLVEANRVEVMLPIVADARKARFERVAKNRARKWRMS